MQRIEIKSRVGDDGVLHLDVPLSADDANREVRIIIQTIPTPEEWQRCILETAGKWQGEFERPEQVELVERDPL
ncbi:MAG TPA: hypothetical protein VN641_16225 [Urbifossiella sp.]|nr:hypothetical protein [Urbifossiella sp.]